MYVTNTQGFTEGEGKAQAKKVFEALDMDKDGKIGIEEFITVGQTSMNIYYKQIPAKMINLYYFRDVWRTVKL